MGIYNSKPNYFNDVMSRTTEELLKIKQDPCIVCGSRMILTYTGSIECSGCRYCSQGHIGPVLRSNGTLCYIGDSDYPNREKYI